MRLSGISAGRAWLGVVLAGACVLGYAHVRLLRATGADRAVQFDLAADDAGGNLVFTWNPAGPWLARAERAEVSIDDGPHRAQMLLLRDQIASGSLLYTPFTKDVRFRLVAHGADGRSAQESIRMLGAEFGSADRISTRHETRAQHPGTVTLQVAAAR